MKHMRQILVLLTVSTALVGGARGLAQNAAQPARPTQTELHWQTSFRDYEVEQRARADAGLSRETLSAQQIAALAPAKFDRDGNGRFDETELKAWLGAVRSAIVASPSAMNRFDTNRDGKLDDDEWAVVLEKIVGKN